MKKSDGRRLRQRALRLALAHFVTLAMACSLVPAQALAEEVVVTLGDDVSNSQSLPPSHIETDSANESSDCEIVTTDERSGVPSDSGHDLILEAQTAGVDDYPDWLKYAGKDSIVDPWLMYNRECTSFVAWRLNNDNGVGFHNTYGGVVWGHAKDWASAARSVGIAVDSNPAVGSVAWWGSGTYGHVAWVQSVNGNSVTIEEYNYDYIYNPGTYNRRTINKSIVDGFIHIKDINTNRDPYGFFDECWDGDGTTRIKAVRIRGWVYDPDSYDTPVRLHVYVGTGSGESCYTTDIAGNKLVANMDRPDLGKACGYDYTIPVEEVGDQPVYVYALNNEGGNNPLLTGGPRTAGIAQVINQVSLEDADITGLSSKAFMGAAIMQVPTVTLNGAKLAVNEDYTLSYKNNVNVGTATVTVTGKGDYTGAKSATFQIVAAPISGAAVAKVANQTYTGKALKPTLAVTFGGATLAVGTDYDAAYTKNTNVGTATVTLTGKGNFSGTTTASFKIVAASLSQATVSAIADQTYTGKALTPKPTVKVGGAALKEGTDYTLAYVDNTKVGTATVTATGKGNYTCAVSTSFKIVKAAATSLAKAAIAPIPQQTYVGEAMAPKPTVTLDGRTLKEGTDYALSYKDNVNVGTATVTVTGKGDYTGAKSATFQIAIPFVDVTMKTGHAGDIGWLYEAGISQGWDVAGRREYRPLANVARADMAAFLFRLAARWGLVADTWKPTGAAAFSDVDDSTSHYREIMWLAEQGISVGWNNGDGTKSFRPYANVARADMAAFLARLYRLRGKATADSKGFLDVDDSTAHSDDIRWLAASGVSKGWDVPGGSEFRPYANVARADMAAFLHRLDALG